MYSIIQGNKHTQKKDDFKIHEAVQNVTPIKYHVLKTQNKTDPEEQIQTYKSKRIIKYLQISPTPI